MYLSPGQLRRGRETGSNFCTKSARVCERLSKTVACAYRLYTYGTLTRHTLITMYVWIGSARRVEHFTSATSCDHVERQLCDVVITSSWRRVDRATEWRHRQVELVVII